MAKGISADYYHAGQGLAERKSIQGAWQRGDVSVVCATIAYGMGIDKANVRLVWMSYFVDFSQACHQTTPSKNACVDYFIALLSAVSYRTTRKIAHPLHQYRILFVRRGSH